MLRSTSGCSNPITHHAQLFTHTTPPRALSRTHLPACQQCRALHQGADLALQTSLPQLQPPLGRLAGVPGQFHCAAHARHKEGTGHRGSTSKQPERTAYSPASTTEVRHGCNPLLIDM
eukprot:1161894-Pelagomonas_calceolata.AAC.6